MDFAKLLCFPHILGSRFRKIILLVKIGSRIKSKIISAIVFGQNYLGSNFLHRHSTEFGRGYPELLDGRLRGQIVTI